jgi:RecJ-like exonuclease
VFGRNKERRIGTQPLPTVACPVCKGVSTVRMSAREANVWHERIKSSEHGAAESVDRPCWACDGKGQIPVERRKSQIGHFSR